MRSASLLLLSLCAFGASQAGEQQALPGATYASIQTLPDFSGFWNVGQPLSAEVARNPPPMRPEAIARIRSARAQDLDPDPHRYCKPYQFVGYSGGLYDSVEFLFTPGRITLINESGLIRRIYMDGRPLPKDVEPTNAGTSVGHWEGTTLVVETTGLNPESKFPQSGPGAATLGKDAHITERIRLKSPDTLEFDVTVVAPGVLIAPDHRTRIYTRATKKTTAREITFCTDHDRSIDPTSGKQRFDMTPPADLPPPPAK